MHNLLSIGPITNSLALDFLILILITITFIGATGNFKRRKSPQPTMEELQKVFMRNYPHLSTPPDKIEIFKWKWINTEGIPICFETGKWDGKRSDLCLCMDEKEELHLAHCYEYDDGQFEWYDKDDFGLQHTVYKYFKIPE